MLNLNDVSLFVQVVDQGGFAAASRQLHLPKSTLSKRIAVLEASLGVRLIHRTSRSFVLTEIGEDFYRHATAMLVEAEAAENVVKDRLAEPSGTVRITASVPTAQISLASLLPEIAARYPRVQIVLHATDQFVDMVRDGFDIGLRDHFKPLPDSELVQRRIGSDPTWLVASPGYLEQHDVPQSPRDIAGHQGLLTSPANTSWLLEKEENPSSKTEVAPLPRFVADESTALLAAADAGLGILCLSRKFCLARIVSGSLVRVLPEWTAGGVTTTLLMPHRRGQVPSVRAVADFLVERLSRDIGDGA